MAPSTVRAKPVVLRGVEAGSHRHAAGSLCSLCSHQCLPTGDALCHVKGQTACRWCCAAGTEADQSLGAGGSMPPEHACADTGKHAHLDG